MQDDVADIGFCPVFATLRCRIREIHLHGSSLGPGSTGRRGCRHTKDAARANPAARAMVLPETPARLFLSVESHRVGWLFVPNPTLGKQTCKIPNEGC